MKQKYVKADMVLNEKGILKESELVVYPINIVAVVGDMEKEVNDIYAPNTEDCNWIGIPPLSSGMRTYLVHRKDNCQMCILLWTPTFEGCSGHYICHDAGHAALEVFNYIHADVGYDDQEPFCYLLGAIYRLFIEAYRELKEFKSKTKIKTKKK